MECCLRLQKQRTRVVDGKNYYKWIVTIPPKAVEELGWEEGVRLNVKVKRNRLVLRRAKMTS